MPSNLRVGRHISYKIKSLVENGGAEGNRTPDLVIANDALSQLSYGPVSGYPA